MKPQIAPNLESFRLPAERLRLIKSACRVLQLFALHMRSVYGEYLLYALREHADKPGFRRWYDAYAMAIHRAERTPEFRQQLLVLDEFYTELLTEAFEANWLRRHLQKLQSNGRGKVFASFERESGQPHLIFPVLTEVNTVKFDDHTAGLLDEDFTEEEIRRLIEGLKHRAGTIYFDGVLFKGKPLAFENKSRFDRSRFDRPEPEPSRSWLSRLLGWLTPSWLAA